MIDLTDLPDGTPIWLTGTAGSVLIVLTLWERLKDVRGPIGALSRWWHTRQIRELERQSAIDKATQEYIAQQVDYATQSMRKSIADLTAQVQDLQQARQSDKQKIADLEESRGLWSAFAAELTAVLLRARQTMAEHGLEMTEPIPKFSDFRARDPT